MPRFTSTLLLICALFAYDMFGQTEIDYDIFQYRYVGPTRGGRVTAVEGVQSQPNVFYMGATGGGLWKTDDYGTSWKNVSDGYFESPSIGDIAVATQDPNIVYVGTGSDGMRSNVIGGRGLYKSIDAGQTWTDMGLQNCGQIGAVRISPQDHNRVFVAAIGQAFSKNTERGVYRTTDGGLHWEKVLYISDTTGILDVEFMPSNPNIIYASAWRTERKPWTIISGGDENGIYKSIDGGDNWKKIGKGLPKLMGKIDLAVSADDSKVVYALVEAPGKETGLYKSEDQGESFTHVSDNKYLLNRAFYYTNIEADPSDANTIYVMGIRFMKSTDGGKSWSYLSAPHGDHHALWINPNQPDLMIQANDGGANVSHNGAQTWSTQMNQPTAELYQVEVDNQYPYWLYAGQQDNYTTVSVPSLPPNSHQAGSHGLIMNTGGCETGPAVPNPDNPNIVYSNCKGRFGVFNKLTGQEKHYDVGAAFMYGHNPKDLKFRFQRVSPIHVSPHDSKVVYHTSQFVHRTTDEGENWEIISPDLTAFEADKQLRSGAPITNDITGEEFYSTIYAIRESPLQKGQIWVGANDGPIHVSTDDGANWSNVTPKSLAGGGRVDCVEPSPHNDKKAYVSVLRYQLGDWTPYIYRTTDMGKSWTLINNGIPADYPVRVVREDPDREGLLYAGTEFGLYISFDDGANWTAFQQNLPVTPITDIKIHRKDMVLSTMGRGFYILDNLSTLHQKLDQINADQVHLFQPENTIRYRLPYISASSGGVSYPSSAVMIDYYLPEEVEGGIQMIFKNSNGKIIKAFTSEKIKEEPQDTHDMALSETIYLLNANLVNEAGSNRFLWDMRHNGAWDKNDNRSYKRGPYVAPGSYTIELIAGDKTMSHSFDIKADPRVLENGVSLADLMAQEKLSLELIDLMSAAKKKANEVEKKLKKEDSDTDALEALKYKLVNKEGHYPEMKFISQVSYLLGIVSRADQIPGKDAYDRYEELKKWFEALAD